VRVDGSAREVVPFRIAKVLEARGVRTPAGRDRWAPAQGFPVARGLVERGCHILYTGQLPAVDPPLMETVLGGESMAAPLRRPRSRGYSPLNLVDRLPDRAALPRQQHPLNARGENRISLKLSHLPQARRRML